MSTLKGTIRKAGKKVRDWLGDIKAVQLIAEGCGECMPYTGRVDKNGYGRCPWEGVGNTLTHRLAYAVAHDLSLTDIEGVVVRHTCDNPPCCNPNHLVVGTHGDNCKDKIIRGRLPVGEDAGPSKLTEAQVREIKTRLLGGERGKVLAKEFGVHVMTISDIKRGATWRHVNVQV
jgi:hypothetical protein